ncbi:hypothetical protein IV203_036136 [Nitzschia inconspicua]|uniref:Uncharacterized protein n=1 Tax=Nitzschia inconspicua TaxID=303405 RepID=A0A9K3LHJ8_9STRA|nr:hypothetical protein IV203_036136 [Nitzschia inconspicua]
MDGDEYFGTLGGSLMKDLLADLQVDDNDWSLEQLEKELASLDQQETATPSLQPIGFPNFDAASLVVSHAQERSAASLFPPSMADTAPPPPGMGGVGVGDGTDAWSLSLQKFTALSLQEDFLAADSARKQNEKRPMPPPGLVALDGAEEYDITEKPAIAPPPGMGAATAGDQIVLPPVGPLLEEMLQPPVPQPQSFPKTPQNSISVGGVASQDSSAIRDAILAAVQPLERKGDTSDDEPLPPSNLSSRMETTVPPVVSPMVHLDPNNIPSGPMVHPPGPMPTPHGQFMPHPPQGMIQMGVPMPMPLPGHGAPIASLPAGVIVGAAVPSGGPAWQTPRPLLPPPQPMVPPPSKIFCNPFPGAPPIPASALETGYMSARDIAYVVHSILKPVLAEPVSEDDYFIQYLKRRMGGAQGNPFTPKKPRDMNSEMMSRETKSKEWASEKSTLGHVTKSNVTRPRALIAMPQPAPTDQDNEHHKQRANLWKARVYCDQAYQAYQKVVDIWRAANPGGGVPPQVQLHLAKLMKCMGIVMDNEKKVYAVDSEALKLLSKLGKGRTLISRVLEQALLPPNAVQALLPVLLSVIIPLPNTIKKGDSDQFVDDFTVDRLFRAITGVMVKLILSGTTLVKCLEAVLSYGKSSISSPPRMECVHALLQKGGMVVGQDPSVEVKSAWGNAETQFTSLLQGV